MSRRFFTILIVTVLCGCQNDDNPETIPYTPIDLHQFSANLKGFNLLGKYDVNWSNPGFAEEDFAITSDLGFNFTRLPLDYLTYTKYGDWNTILEDEVAEIDQAIQWGQQYGVHICIDLHRAPGYSVNTSPIPAHQQVSLWDNASAQQAFLNHWKFFAERYKDVPNTQLSFNLLNEPDYDVVEGTYVTLMKKAIEVIHSINPNRIVFVDGMHYSRDIILSLQGTRNVIQSLHAYDPIVLTHYKASWVGGSDTWPVPVWPVTDISNYLFGPWQSNYQTPLILNGTFEKDSKIILNVRQVSNQSQLEVRLDDQIIYTKDFTCGPDLADDWTEIVNTQWGYQNISNKNYEVLIPANGAKLTLANTVGDWMTLNKITIQSDGGDLIIIPGDDTWGAKQTTYNIDENGRVTDAEGNPMILKNLYEKFEAARDLDIPIMIQEFGVHNETPHNVTVDFLEYEVKIFRDYNIGYALWNLSGSFGIIDSERSDCAYESYRGKLLDEKLLEIIE